MTIIYILKQYFFINHFLQDCTESDPPCPLISLDRLVFEMNKKYKETQLQVVVSPLILTTTDVTSRPAPHTHLNQGFVVLSGLQVLF